MSHPILHISSNGTPSTAERGRSKVPNFKTRALALPLIAMLLALGLMMYAAASVRADIVRWDNGITIPGTQGITLGPAIDLSGWNQPNHNLRYAKLSAPDLSGANFAASDLSHSRINGGPSQGRGGNPDTTVTSANFTNAIITYTNLFDANGFTAAQLVSTKSYAQRNLSGVQLDLVDLSNIDFSHQNLAGADFSDCNLSGADFSGAIITGIDFGFNSHLQS